MISDADLEELGRELARARERMTFCLGAADHLGHRTADCAAGGYVLTDADPDRTHALVAERAVRS